MGGALVLHVKNGEGSLLWGHSTESMSVGYMKTTDTRPKVKHYSATTNFLLFGVFVCTQGLISKLPQDVSVGLTVNVGGTHFDVSEVKIPDN